MSKEMREYWLGLLKIGLDLIEKADTDYEVREQRVYDALRLAHICGLQTGFGIDPAKPEWPVAMIELPTGQVGWHMPQHPVAYDGHTTEEKYRRIREWTGGRKPVKSGNGRGSVYQRGYDGRWCARITVGFEVRPDGSKKQLRKTVYATSQAEAQVELIKLQGQR